MTFAISTNAKWDRADFGTVDVPLYSSFKLSTQTLVRVDAVLKYAVHQHLQIGTLASP